MITLRDAHNILNAGFYATTSGSELNKAFFAMRQEVENMIMDKEAADESRRASRKASASARRS